MKKSILFFSVLTLGFLTAFAPKDRTQLLSRQWVLVSMNIDGQAINEDMMARQRQKGPQTVLQFNSDGACYIHIFTRKGKITKLNKWQFQEEQTHLLIEPEDEDAPTQRFFIRKISNKELVLVLHENKQEHLFAYRALKKK